MDTQPNMAHNEKTQGGGRPGSSELATCARGASVSDHTQPDLFEQPARKRCFKCDTLKPLDEFYRHPMMTDGHLGKCKECAKRDVRENRAKRIEYYKEYDRQRSGIPKRVKRRKGYYEYMRTERPALKASRSVVSNRKHRDKYPEKYAAKSAVRNAIRAGTLSRPSTCSKCGNGGLIHGHHEDYSKPLDVIWLCRPCHTALHVAKREEARRLK